MTTLYRKYRPSTFSSVTGQEHIIKTITNEITLGKLAHAYLFSGPRGVGKTTTARLLAKAVNCLSRKPDEFEPCNACSSCTEISQGASIDVIEIDAASQTGVDNVRENIIENAQFKPTKAKYKVFIIDEVHMLSTSAFNALLKTLEEPPAHVIFILATTELHKLPATVISRCERFHFKKVLYDVIVERLQKIAEEEKIKVEKDVLARIAQKSDGCLRDAESLLGQLFSLNLKKITSEDAELILPTTNAEHTVQFAVDLLKGSAPQALTALQQLAEEGVNFEQFANDLLEVLRTLLLRQAGAYASENYEYSKDIEKKIDQLSKEITPALLSHTIDSLLKRRLHIRTSPLPQLPLELLVVETAASQPIGTAGTIPVSTESAPQPTHKASTDVPSTKQPNNFTQTIKNTISHFAHPSEPVKTTLGDIKNKWDNLLHSIAETNHSLTFILKMCMVQKVEGDTLHLSVPYSLHKEKLEEQKNKLTIEQCLEKLFAEKIRILCTVTETVNASNADIVTLAAEFGGEVVN